MILRRLLMRVVVDTSVFITRRLFGAVVRPQAVLEELLAGGDTQPLSDAVTAADWIRTEFNPKGASLRPELGRGETAAISLAYESEADLVILDDLQARRVAAGLGLRVTGTMGVLIAARKEGYGPDVEETIRLLRGAGFRMSADLLAAFRRI